MTTYNPAFVAYPSKDKALKIIISEAIEKVNAISARRFETWECNDIAGKPLISPILTRIDEADIVVADITYLNLNVIYEIGFTLGRSKRVFLIRHAGTLGDKDLANEAGIFDTLGYFEYSDQEHLKKRLSSFLDIKPLPVSRALNSKAPVYVVEPLTKDSAATLSISRIKKAGYRIRTFNPSEDVRLAANDALTQVAASSGVVTILQSDNISGAVAHNVRALFVVGLAHGMGKPTLALNPVGLNAPLDIRDDVKTFSRQADIIEHIADFSPEINKYSQQVDPPPILSQGLLQALSVGDPTAENEMATLGSYYLRTDQYSRAVRGEVNLVVGRKGSGKTALFIGVRDKTRADKRNIVVDLKPEGYQLVKLKEEILSYLTEGTRQHLITAFWEYLILLEVAYKLLEKDKNTYKFNHEIHRLYSDLDSAYRVDNFSSEGDFSERLLTLSQSISSRFKEKYGEPGDLKLSSDQVTELLHSHDIRILKQRISKYIEKKQSVWILFDNLDKGWSTHGVDAIDVISLRCLIDAGRKVEREMERTGHVFHCIIFVRNDVYDHLMQKSADYGKEMRAVLDWTDRDLLKQMMRLRLIASLDGKSSEMTFDQIWRTICVSHIDGEDSADYILDRTLMRPRNLLKIFNHGKGFATNLNHTVIDVEDFEKGLKAYSQDLIIELDRELLDVFPNAAGLIYYFIDSPPILDRKKITALTIEAGLLESDVDKVVDFLLYYGVMGIKSTTATYYIYDVNYDLKLLKIRASRLEGSILYYLNPAFWPALNVQNVGTQQILV